MKLHSVLEPKYMCANPVLFIRSLPLWKKPSDLLCRCATTACSERHCKGRFHLYFDAYNKGGCKKGRIRKKSYSWFVSLLYHKQADVYKTQTFWYLHSGSLYLNSNGIKLDILWLTLYSFVWSSSSPDIAGIFHHNTSVAIIWGWWYLCNNDCTKSQLSRMLLG